MKNSEYKMSEQNSLSLTDYRIPISKLLSILKLNKNYEKYQKIFDSKNNLLIDFNFFRSSDNWIVEYLIGEKKNIVIKTLFEKKLNENIYNLFVKWLYFLYCSLCENLDTTIKMKKINKMRYLFFETNDIIIKLYSEDFFDLEKVISFLTFYTLLFEINIEIQNSSDIIIKVKNYVLLSSLFYLLKQISIEVIKKINTVKDDELDEKSKNELQVYFDFLEYFKKNEEINSSYNKIIIIKHNMIQSFLITILDNLPNINIIKNYNIGLKNKLINFFSNFFEYNYKKSKILSVFLDYLKKAFVNLYNFENNKIKIEQNLFIQALYLKLMKQIIFSNEEISNRKKKHHPIFNSFLFNGLDSEISFEVKKKDFEKTTLFFSFYILPLKNRQKYELFLIEKNHNNKKTPILELYLKQTDHENCLLCVKNENGDENILQGIKIIKNYKTIYIALTFNSDKLVIQCYDECSFKSEETNKDKKLFDSGEISFKFGAFKKKSDSIFHGYIGPIIVIKNPKPLKNFKLPDVIRIILSLGKYYKYFVYINSNKLFNFDYFKIFPNDDFKISAELVKNLKLVIDKKENFNCLLYLTPDLLKLSNKLAHLPEVPNICEIQKEYKILKINMTLAKFEDSLESFIIDDGLNYIALLYEYLYQLIQNYDILKDEGCSDIIDYKDNNYFIIKNITSIFRKSLFFLDKIFFDLKYVYFKKSMKLIFKNLFLCLKILSQREQKIIDKLLNYIFEIINKNNSMIRTNYINLVEKRKSLKDNEENEIKNILETYQSFRDGLFDIILSLELYDENKRDALLTLFNQFIDILEEDEQNQYSVANEYIFYKLLNFTEILVIYFNDYKFDDDTNSINVIVGNSNSNKLINSFLKTLKFFFKIDIKYFKLLFHYILQNCCNNNNIICTFFNFLNSLTHEEFNIYFKYDDGTNEDNPIGLIMKNSKKLIKLKKNDNKILKIILSTIVKIVFSKITIKYNKKYINKFKNFLHDIKSSEELSNTITDILTREIKKLIDNELKINEKPKPNISSTKKCDILSYDQLKNISNFYLYIFDFIFYLFGNNNENKETQLLYLLLNEIEKSIKDNIDRDIDLTSSGQNGTFTIDTIFCIINFIKFYNNIIFNENLFNLICDEKYIQNFINICLFAHKTCLINSNILIEVKISAQKITKTIVEIIFDNCFYFMIHSNLDIKNVDKESSSIKITRCQEIIYNFVDKVAIKKYINKKKGKISNDRYSIFYINDYFRFLNSLQLEKKSKQYKNLEDDDFYKSNICEFMFYPKINKLLTNENKFECNFTTFFFMKISGYKQLISDFLVSIENDEKNSKICSLLMKLIDISHYLLNEHVELLEKNKEFFFKSTKNKTSFEKYNTVKSLVYDCIKKNSLSEVDAYIKSIIFKEKEDYEKIYLTVYSGQCKILNKKASFSIFNFFSNNSLPEVDQNQKDSELLKKNLEANKMQSSDNLTMNTPFPFPLPQINNLNNTNNSPKSFSGCSKNSDDNSQNDDSSEDEKLKLNIEEDIEINIDNSNHYSSKKSDTIKNENDSEKKNIENNNDLNTDENDSLPPLAQSISSPIFDRRKSGKDMSLKSANSISENSENLIKSNKIYKLRNDSKISQFSEVFKDIDIINSHLCYFDIPDECYIFNAKKEFMSNIFALNFIDYFYKNQLFIKMKYYYLQNLKGAKRKNKFFDFPSKIKNFNNGLEPCLFLKPFKNFFRNIAFSITHEYFHKRIIDDKLSIENIFLHQKELPDFNYTIFSCELIKIDQEYYGDIIADEKQNFLIFKEKVFDYSQITNINSIKYDENKLFSISFINKKPMEEKALSNYESVKNQIIDKDKKFSLCKQLIILFSEIDEILERRFLFMWQGVEIFLKNGKSYFFNMLTTQNYKKLLKIFENNKLTKNKIHTKNYFEKHKITNEWQLGRLTTYEYLLLLNKYASRTYNDTNQYPIFPWIILKYDKDEKTNKIKKEYRELKYPICAQTEQSREKALERFEEGSKFTSHYGTHYSNACYIYYYLMREEPYNTLLVKLQSYKNENPNRMFFDLNEILRILTSGCDNRECIPEFFTKIEQFINLNCCDYDVNSYDKRIDDFYMSSIFKNNKERSLKNYVSFILENRYIINNKKISDNICNWIDNVFGVNQLPEIKKKESFNIFGKESYEQKTNLLKKFEKYKNQEKYKEILDKINYKITAIISFGQTPQQIFKEKHQKRKNLTQEVGEFESTIDNAIWNQQRKLVIEKDTLYFDINNSSEKIYLLDKSRKISIINTNLFAFECSEYKFDKFSTYQVQLPHIKLLKKTKIGKDLKHYILKPKYSFSSFDFEEKNKNNDDYNSFYKTQTENLNKKIRKSSDKNPPTTDEFYKFITCRYSDNTFKIIQIPKNKSKKDDIYICNPISYFCEDFVSSCCTISPNKFLIGLRNGKLIQWSFDYSNDENEEKSSFFKIKFNQQIQAHKSEIDVIEIDKRLGIIITAGKDNFVFIRKLYDFELLTPIKIKNKYIITMIKISPINFIYIMCYNKLKKKSKIFGYTLTGIPFAKSGYNYYVTFDCTKKGNIISLIQGESIKILLGASLKEMKITQKDDDPFDKVKKKINGSNWIQFNYFTRKDDINSSYSKILTYIKYDENNQCILGTLDVKKIKYFE